MGLKLFAQVRLWGELPYEPKLFNFALSGELIPLSSQALKRL